MARTAIGRAFALAALIALALGSTAAAHNGSSLASAQDETPSGWLVELSGSAETFRRQAGDAGIHVKERAEFSALWNGVSVEATPSDVSALRTLDGVTAVYPNVVASVPPADLAVAAASQTTGAAVARSELGFDGSGVRVGVIDSGVDWQHPDLGGCFGTGCRVALGWDFVGDAYDPNPASPTYSPVPFRTPIPTTATAMARTSPASSARAAG